MELLNVRCVDFDVVFESHFIFQCNNIFRHYINRNQMQRQLHEINDSNLGSRQCNHFGSNDMSANSCTNRANAKHKRWIACNDTNELKMNYIRHLVPRRTHPIEDYFVTRTSGSVVFCIWCELSWFTSVRLGST